MQVARRRLILVRHSQSQPESGVDAPLWKLTPLGRRRCLALAEVLRGYRIDRLYCSYERKAVETAEITAMQLRMPVEVLQGIHEHVRAGAPYLSREAFLHTIKRLFDRQAELIFGSETAQEALTRFSRGISDVVARDVEGDLAVVTHGTVLSLFVAAHSDWDPYHFWQKLGQPALAIFDLPSLTLAQITFTV